MDARTHALIQIRRIEQILHDQNFKGYEFREVQRFQKELDFWQRRAREFGRQLQLTQEERWLN